MTVEILIGFDGVRSLRVYGTDWQDGAAAYTLLERLNPIIQQLDLLAKEEGMSATASSPKKGFFQ